MHRDQVLRRDGSGYVAEDTSRDFTRFTFCNFKPALHSYYTSRDAIKIGVVSSVISKHLSKMAKKYVD